MTWAAPRRSAHLRTLRHPARVSSKGVPVKALVLAVRVASGADRHSRLEDGGPPHPAQCDQGSRGWERFCDPAYDAAFDLSQSTAPLEERMAGYDDIAQIFMDQQLRLPVYVIQNNIAASADVQGFVRNPNDSLNLRGVSVEEG